ncbi:MAG: dynamin family protein [Desulfobacterales bacterium]|nr:MAG: dynamin family protein [Desulfobacterales bacterium]
MSNYQSIKEELLQVNQDILKLFQEAALITGKTDNSFSDWKNTCNKIQQQLSEEMIRVAVVGPIKSGKSTFINSVLKGDYLKRGAGVVTSIVTRVRKGKLLKAKLFLKSWDEVNTEVDQALVLFPSLNWRTERDRFDIRRKKERIELKQALDTLTTDQLITKNSRTANSVLLSSYLKGYDVVKDLMSTHALINRYDPGQFEKHWSFVGNEYMAVYLKDIELQIDSNGIDTNIELADCQGSDSSNPLHLAMIQDYLLATHLIVYVVSSRTGIREADIKFLSMIKKMGIIDNILFIINCDFSEHESIDDLQGLLEKIREELSTIKTDPDIYSISALFNLFKAQLDHLSKKNINRLKQWQKEHDLVDFSESETQRFETAFNNRLTKERYALLLKNHLERLDVIATGMDHWIYVHQNIIAQDALNISDVIEKVKQHQNRVDHIKSMIKNTLEGSIQKIKNELRSDIDRFFDVRSGKVLKDIVEFIKHYKIPYQKYEESLKSSGFSNTLYYVFQEFKQALDTFMAETINPEVIRFVNEKEKRILEHLDSISFPFDALVQETIVEYKHMIKSFGIDRTHENNVAIELPAIDPIKDITGLTIPPAVATMRYTAGIKTEAVMRLGFYTILKVFKKLLKKSIRDSSEGELLALKYSILRMKRETERSVVFHFKDYRENIKFQYIFKLVEAVSNSHYQTLLNRFQSHASDLSDIVDLIDNKKIDKEHASDILLEMGLISKNIKNRIRNNRENIKLTI